MHRVRVDNRYTPIYHRGPHFSTFKDKLMRDAAINLRARPVQRDLIDQAAKLLGKNRSGKRHDCGLASASAAAANPPL